jgi:hypothetical protein
MIHVYAFAERLRALPPIDGVDGAGLETVEIADVAAVFSRRRQQTSSETLQTDALAHGTVVDALRGSAATVVPVRFGEELDDDEAVGQTVGARLGEIRRTFDRVRGCDEIGLRVWGGARAATGRAVSGTAYMQTRHAAESKRRDTVDGLHVQLSSIAREARAASTSTSDRELFSAAYLVASSRLQELRAAVDAFTDANPELTVVCTGPWAPFNFTDEEQPR